MELWHIQIPKLAQCALWLYIGELGAQCATSGSMCIVALDREPRAQCAMFGAKSTQWSQPFMALSCIPYLDLSHMNHFWLSWKWTLIIGWLGSEPHICEPYLAELEVNHFWLYYGIYLAKLAVYHIWLSWKYTAELAHFWKPYNLHLAELEVCHYWDNYNIIVQGFNFDVNAVDFMQRLHDTLYKEYTKCCCRNV